VADPDIRLGGKFNMFLSISCKNLFGGGPKSMAKLDGGEFAPLDPRLSK